MLDDIRLKERHRWTSWQSMVERVMDRNGESMADIVGWTVGNDSWDQSVSGEFQPLPNEFHREFYPDYGEPEGTPFRIWTARYVYFPLSYDGQESVDAIPRHPTPDTPVHYGKQW